MTAPLSVGAVSVDVEADVSKLAKDLKKKFERELAGLDFSKAISKAVGDKPFKVKIDPVVDKAKLREQLGAGARGRGTGGGSSSGTPGPDRAPRTPKPEGPKKPPKIPVELDPVVAAFQAEVRRQASQLAKQVAVKIPVEGDGGTLRRDLSAEIQQIQQQLKVKIPAGAANAGEYERELRTLVDRVEGTIRVHIPAEVSAREAAASARRAAKLAQAATPPIEIPARVGGGSAISSLLSNLAGVASSVVGQLGGVAQSLSSIGSAAGTAAIATGIVAGVGFAASAAVPAVFALAGALASLPGLIAGAAAGFGALKLGFAGISDAFKKKAGGGGGGGGGGGESAEARARRIAAAERGVEAARRGIAAASRGLQQAQRGLVEAQESYAESLLAEKRAQEAVARARKTAQERIDDLGRSLRGAVLDEKEAQFELRNAARDLAAAQTTFNPELIQDAELRYERAKFAVEEAADQVSDLGEENADAAKKGVEGSDEVVAALQDQKDAQKAVRDAANGIIDAQDRLASANDGVKASYDSLISAQDALAQAKERAASAGGGGGGGGLDDTIKLAPEAQKFVDAIKRLGPAFDGLRLDVQNRLFKGLGTEITNLANAWLPQLRETLGSYADTFNGLAKNLSSSLQKPEFIDDIATGAETIRSNFEKIGKVVTGPLVEAFGNLSEKSKPFLDAIGSSIANGLQAFADKVNEMAANGELDKFFQDATDAFNDLKDIAKDVGSIIGSFFEILTGEEQSDEESPFKQFKGFMDDLAETLKDPETQERIRGYIDDFKEFTNTILGLIDKADSVNDFFKGLDPGTDGVFLGAYELPAAIAGWLGDVDWAGLGSTIKTKAGEIGGAIWDGLKAGWEAVADVGSWIASKLWSGPDSLVGKVKSGLGIASPSRVFTQIGRDTIQGLLNGLTSMFGSLSARAREIPGRVRDAVGNAGSTLVQKGRDFVNGLRNGITGMFGSLSSAAGSLRTRVTSAVGSTIGMLYSAGQNVVRGLWNGITSLGSWLFGNLSAWVSRNVPGPIKKALGIASPSKVAAMLGEEIPRGLALGMERQASLAADAATLVAQAAIPDITSDPYGIYAQAEAAFSAGMTLPAPPSPELAWAADATGDQVLDAFRRLIVIRHGGDVQRALGKGIR